MYLIDADDVNDAAIKQCHLINYNNRAGDSRNGAVMSVNRVLTRVNNVQNKWLVLNGRNNSIIATVAEIMWIFRGDNRIDDWLVKYLPRAIDYSDDGKTWRAGYGERMYEHYQLDSVVNRIIASPDTRQSMLSLYDPSLDTDHSLMSLHGTAKTKDQPCNNLLYFFKEDGKLHMHLTNRSNDVIWGAWSINFQEFVTLLEVVSQLTGIPVGTYSVYQNNLHVYTSNEIAYTQFNAIVNNTHALVKASPSRMHFGKITGQVDLRLLFDGLINSLNDNDLQSAEAILRLWDVNEDSELYDWVRLINAYNQKKLQVPQDEYQIEIKCDNLRRAVVNDKFNKNLLK